MHVLQLKTTLIVFETSLKYYEVIKIRKLKQFEKYKRQFRLFINFCGLQLRVDRFKKYLILT